MQQSIQEKLQVMTDRFEEIGALLSDPGVIGDQNKFRALSVEYSDLTPLVQNYEAFQKAEEDLESATEMLAEDDAEMQEMAKLEVAEAKARIEILEAELQVLLLPKDPLDDANIFIEIRAGTGGDEAALFAGDLYRMYARYAETAGYQLEVVSENEGEHGGYKEIILRCVGKGAYSKLKFESGGHRVQRVPETESQGRIHTSACTVAILPEVDAVEEIAISSNDLRVDTFRASGAGGQHVNKTDSAIRLTHLPSGIVVECQDQRSQHKNRARAMSVLQAKLLEAERSKQHNEEAETRRDMVGSGDRSQRIRTYNFPQGRLTDHRINLTLYKLDDIMNGALGQVIEPLIQEYQADQLLELTKSA